MYEGHIISSICNLYARLKRFGGEGEFTISKSLSWQLYEGDDILEMVHSVFTICHQESLVQFSLN